MSFNPDTDAAYAALQAQMNKLSGPDREEYIQNLLEYLCNLHTSSTALSPGAMATTVNTIEASRKQHKRTF